MVSIEIPEEFLFSSPPYSVKELKVDLAVLLYKRKRMSLAKAARWCGLSRLEFQSAMSERNVDIIFSEDDLKHDIKTLDKFFS